MERFLSHIRVLIMMQTRIKQGQLQEFAQHHVQSDFEYIQEQRLHNLPEQPVPAFDHPHSKKLFLVSRLNKRSIFLSCTGEPRP